MTGISWARQTERLRDAVRRDFEQLVLGPTVNLPLYRLGDLGPPGSLTGRTADFVIIDDPFVGPEPPTAA